MLPRLMGLQLLGQWIKNGPRFFFGVSELNHLNTPHTVAASLHHPPFFGLMSVSIAAEKEVPFWSDPLEVSQSPRSCDICHVSLFQSLLSCSVLSNTTDMHKDFYDWTSSSHYFPNVCIFVDISFSALLNCKAVVLFAGQAVACVLPITKSVTTNKPIRARSSPTFSYNVMNDTELSRSVLACWLISMK